MLPKLSPMLAMPATPFDASEYSFEVKWDGIRALAAVDASGWRMWGRERADYTDRYPEFDMLRCLPTGTLVDGELVAFDPQGRPDLPRLLRRHGLTGPGQFARPGAGMRCATCCSTFYTMPAAACCTSRWRQSGC